jgi:hypothetical protein
MTEKIYCQSCGKELNEGDPVLRLQYGKLHYNKRAGLKKQKSGSRPNRENDADDYVCVDCIKAGNVAIRQFYSLIVPID